MKWYQLVLCLIPSIAHSQIEDLNYISWSPTRKLAVADFVIKTKPLASNPCFAQFTIGFGSGHVNLFNGNVSYKVFNSFLKSASWIDTTSNVEVSLRYQQTLFDLAEIYTRHLRRDLQLNRRQLRMMPVKLLPNFLDKLNAEVMAEFAKRRVEYDEETKFGSVALEQKRWELDIQRELSELHEYILK
ncbi:hypothetical protein [Spirosoma jeollabukense]